MVNEKRKTREAEAEEEGIAEALPWLNHMELGPSMVALPVHDAARGLEPWSIPVINTVDTVRYPSFSFVYSSSSILLTHPVPFSKIRSIHREHSSNISSSSCEASMTCSLSSSSSSSFGLFEEPSSSSHLCTGTSVAPSSPSASSCTCVKASMGYSSPSSSLCGRDQINGDLVYSEESKLRCLTEGRKFEGLVSFTECGPSCSCSQRCGYRVTQRGIGVKVCVTRDKRKGWCLRATQFIPKGSFAFEYAGEFLTTLEAQKRQRLYDQLRKTRRSFVPSLLVVREHLPSGNTCIRWNIDATRVGNVARFVNHSCDGGNLQPCLVRLSGSIIPRLVFFAKLDILDEEELTFSYGDSINRSNTYPCFCGTACCNGFLPSENT